MSLRALWLNRRANFERIYYWARFLLYAGSKTDEAALGDKVMTMTPTLTQLQVKPVERARRGVAGRYIEFCADHLHQLEESIVEHDLASVSRIAQVMKGNARFVGLGEISSLGGQLEQYCMGDDWAAIDAAYRAIADTVLKLCSGAGLRVEVKQAPAAPEQTVTIKKST